MSGGARRLTRRALLKGGVVLGAGLVVGFALPRGVGRAGAQGASVFAPNQWLRIDADGLVTIVNSVPEMGQGTSTAMVMIVADELDADLARVRVEQAPADPARYANPVTGAQSYGGSRGIRDHLEMWRKAGAAAREMLKQAAAQEWGEPVESVETELGAVVHTPTGRRLSYGRLVEKARQLPVPQNPTLKTPEQFRYIGKDVERLDIPAKVSGQAVFGLDVQVPGMLVATIQKCPVFGGTVRSFDASLANAVRGVRHVVQVSSGVAVVADTFWAARKGRQALRVTWNEGPLAQLTSAQISREYASLARQPGRVARSEGDVAKALAAAGRTLEAVYQVPYLHHATMEPMNCTAHVTADACTVWAPTQNPGGSQAIAAKLTALPVEQVSVHTTLLGGGFGRRGEVDFVIDAVETSKAVGAPVKVVWTREDDMQHGFYRPATYNVLRAALDERGLPSAWFHRIVGPGIVAQKGSGPPGTIDRTAVEGARNIPYDIPNLQVEWVEKDPGVPVGFWRSVGASQNAYVVEGFVDELAGAAGRDPVEYRLALLGQSPRLAGVLELAARQAAWGTPLPPGRARGVAVAASYESYAAEVAEVSLAPDGAVRVHRVVCAIDCGFAVDPDQVRAQMEGSVVYGLTAALHGRITIERGRVVQSNFGDYPMLRIGEMPRVEVHILESGEKPGGIGQPGVPPLAPAVCNALFALTGKRIRELPIARTALRA
jgi:isoquinoline 1-oxidoreductase subunit beta